jgi:hypothetical protein
MGEGWVRADETLLRGNAAWASAISHEPSVQKQEQPAIGSQTGGPEFPILYTAGSGENGSDGVSTRAAFPGSTLPPATTTPSTPHLNFGMSVPPPSIFF